MQLRTAVIQLGTDGNIDRDRGTWYLEQEGRVKAHHQTAAMYARSASYTYVLLIDPANA